VQNINSSSNFHRNIEESEIQELLDPVIYEQFKTALDKNEIAKDILSHDKKEDKICIKKKLNRRKRTREELSLQWNEKFILHQNHGISKNSCPAKMSKKEKKAKYKRSISPLFEKDFKYYPDIQCSRGYLLVRLCKF